MPIGFHPGGQRPLKLRGANKNRTLLKKHFEEGRRDEEGAVIDKSGSALLPGEVLCSNSAIF